MSINKLQQKIASRRVLAIISHPDAGKTTITEKLLLIGNLIQVAGTVKGKKVQPLRNFGLDDYGKATWYFRDLIGHAISLQGLCSKPA